MKTPGINRQNHISPLRLLILLALVLLTVAAGGGQVYLSQEARLRLDAENSLQAIAAMKVDMLSGWLNERVGDATVLMKSQFFGNGIARWMQHPDSVTGAPILSRFETMREQYHYAEIILTDTSGHVRLSLGKRAAALYGNELPALEQALRERRPVLLDFHIDSLTQTPRIGVVAPLYGLAEQTSGPAVGAVVLLSEAARFPYPLIQTWPTPSRSAETLLVRRDGDSVLFLNDLRFRQDAALRLGFPLSKLDLPAAMAVQGKTGIVEGTDYRGVKVLASLNAVPGTPWCMIAKIDSAEIFHEWRIRSILILALTLLMLLASGAVAGIIWQSSQKAHYRSLSQAQEALRESELFKRVLIDHLPLRVFLKDRNSVYITCNSVFAEDHGMLPEQIEGRDDFELNPRELAEAYRADDKAVMESGRPKEIREGRLANGLERWARTIKVPYRDDNGKVIGILGILEDITEALQVEQTLKDKEELLSMVGQVAKIGGWEFDVATGEGAWTDQVARIHDMDPDEPVSAEIGLSCFQGGMRQKIDAAIDAAIRLEKPYDIELEMVTARGNRRWVRAIGYPVKENGKIVKLRGSIQDISSQIEMKEAQRKSEKKYGFLFENMLNGFAYCKMLYDEAGRPQDFIYLSVNSAFEKLTGLKDVTGRNVSAIIPGLREADPELFEIYGRVARSGAPERFETYVSALKMWFWISVYSPKAEHFVAVFDVITERKQAELRVQHLNQVLRALRNANQLIVRENDRGRLIQSACDLLVELRSYNSAYIVLTDKDDRPVTHAQAGLGEALQSLAEYLEHGNLPPCCALARQTSNPYVISERTGICDQCPLARICQSSSSMCMRLLHGGACFGYLAVSSDSSLATDAEEQSLFAELASDLGYALHTMQEREAREQGEKERLLLEAQLLQSQKMEAVGRLAGGVAHDFNNMLSVILGYTELALAKLKPGNKLTENLKAVQKAAGRSAELTAQLLAFARKQTITPKVLDVNGAIGSMLKMLGRLVGEDINLLWKPDKEAWPVKMDPAQLDQIFANLVVNARDAISAAGKVTIETKNFSLDKDYCENHAGFIPGDFVMLAVSDNGKGMDRAILEHIFEPFFTTKTIGHGTGLGLATVYGIVKQNDGFIYVYSEPEHGTTFKIYLPRHKDGKAEVIQKGAPGVVPTGTETILLVEDEEQLLTLGEQLLHELGYKVLAAGSGTDALRLAAEFEGEIHLLLTDIVMPGISGRELLQRLETTRPAIKCLYTSGYTANVISHHGVLEEGIHFIQKPFSLETLALKVREALETEPGSARAT